MSRGSLRCKGYVIVLAVCLIYWILVSLWGFFSFDLNLKSMIFFESSSLWDYFTLNLSAYQVISRVLVLFFMITTGALIVELSVKRRIAEEEKRRADERLSQASKLESLGRLAGGVAHDLNNLLTPILGYADMELARCEDRELKESLNNIIDAALRSRDLVSQLLAFGRKTKLEVATHELNGLIRKFRCLLEKTLREDVRLTIKLWDETLPVRCDKGQIEQIVMNLIINGQDAMAGGGEIVLGTEKRDSRVLLYVSDQGTGISPEEKNMIFEPFYSTKQKGKGTGLGLATVYGIVRQHGGEIDVVSQLGKGASFRIFLPLAGRASRGNVSR